MMFLETDGPALAISQPAHAWVAGQILRAWPGGLDALLLLAAEQHDLAWLDWETRPAFDPAAGRPKLFRDVGAAEHAPAWTAAVERALAAWGRRVALLVSRHGGLIYRRFTDRHRMDAADADAAEAYLSRQAPLEAEWARSLGLASAALQRDTELIALADTLSLGLCGGVELPLQVQGPGAADGTVTYRMERQAGRCTLSPWPFASGALAMKVEARPIPGGRFADEAAMRHWLGSPARESVELRLLPA